MNARADNPPRQLLTALLDAVDVDSADSLEDAAHDALDAVLDSFSVVEQAALCFDYQGFWARRKQLIPRGRPRFSSWGFMTGRGYGKTWSIAAYLVDQILDGRARSIALMAQSKEKTLEVMVHGPSGLIAMSPTWFRPQFVGGEGRPSRLVWPNGAEAVVYSPNRPEEPRGPEHDYAWLSELVAWPKTKRDEALKNIEHATRVGDAVTLWDTTPKRKHPLVRSFLARAEEAPERHVVIRGHSAENIDNLNRQRLEELMRKLEGTQRGDEELSGIFLEDDESALWEQGWIDSGRAPLPDRLERRALGIDPATSDRAGTDDTGYVEAAVADGQAYVVDDQTGTYQWDAWGMKAVRRYVSAKLDVIVIERNKGGDACAHNLRYSCAELVRENDRAWQSACERAEADGLELPKRPQAWRVELVHEPKGKRVVTSHVPGVIYVKEIHTRLTKHDKARPVATLYKHGKVSHVSSADLQALEDTMTTWEPGEGKSPDAIDALCYALSELVDLTPLVVDFSQGFKGIGALHQELKSATAGKRRGRVSRILDQLGRNEWRSTL
jgi:phage terminase large subunit-like protein